MNYKDFIKWATAQDAKTLDYDGVYGLQCVDLIKWYVKKVRGITPQSIGNAIDYYKNRDCKYLKDVTADGGSIFTFSASNPPQSFNFIKGDIVVFGGSKNGHIAIFNGDKNGTRISVYDTNYRGKHTTAKIHFYDLNNRECKCVIRMSNKYTQITETKYFTPDATINKKCFVYADMKCKETTGMVYNGERVKIHFIGNKLALIQYSVTDGYKVGLINKNHINKD